MVYMERSSEAYGYTKGKLCGVVKSSPPKGGTFGMVGAVLCSASSPGFEIVRDNMQ